MRQATLIAISALLVILAGLIWNSRNPAPLPPPAQFSPPPLVAPSPAPPAIRPAQNSTGLPLALPAGFSISIFAKNLGAPRDLVLDPAGRVLASITAEGKVVALEDADADGVAETARTILSGLSAPHGLAFNCATAPCTLYVAETARVSAYAYDAASARTTFLKKIADLPDDGGHFTRTLLFLPPPNDKKLLVSVGSSCNVCIESDWRRAKILIYDTETGVLEAFAGGLRNAVFMTRHPVTGAIWATEMGRDWLGDDLPPDEINIIEEGKFYGWPYCYGKNIWDRTFDASPAASAHCSAAAPSRIDIPAHSAPLGLAFWGNDLLVAYHGSWNRSVPTGYKVVRHKFDASGTYLGAEDFITGWLTPQNEVLGRPVDILVAENDTIFISDDKAGVIYRMRGPKED